MIAVIIPLCAHLLHVLLKVTHPISEYVLNFIYPLIMGKTKTLPPIDDPLLLLSATELAAKIRKKQFPFRRSPASESFIDMDLFPRDVSESLESLFQDADHWNGEIHRVQAFILFMEDNDYQRVLQKVLPEDRFRQYRDAFSRCLAECKHTNHFDPKRLQWVKIAKRLLRSPDRQLKNADTRMAYKLDHMFLVKHGFTFGHCQVPRGEYHVFQLSAAPMVCYHLPEASVKTPSQPNVYRRAFNHGNQYLYKRFVFKPHCTYYVSPGTHYLIMTTQKTLFSVDAMLQPVGFDTDKSFTQTTYNVPPPTPQHTSHIRHSIQQDIVP